MRGIAPAGGSIQQRTDILDADEIAASSRVSLRECGKFRIRVLMLISHMPLRSRTPRRAARSASLSSASRPAVSENFFDPVQGTSSPDNQCRVPGLRTDYSAA